MDCISPSSRFSRKRQLTCLLEARLTHHNGVHILVSRSFRMRSRFYSAFTVCVVATIAFVTGFSMGQEKPSSGRIYELRTYTTLPGRLPALNKRFAEHTMRL